MVFHDTLALQILEAAPYAVVVAGEDGNIVYANAQCTAIFGFGVDELIGNGIEMLVPPSVRRGHEARRAEFHGRPHVRPMGAAREIQGVRKDGSVFHADIMLSPVRLSGATYVLAMVRDDTERREKERQLAALGRDLARKNQELQRSNHELEAFAFTASHDLQEPLRKIVAFGDRLARRAGPALDDTSRDYLGRVTDAAKRMQSLIDDLLQWSRLTRRPTEPKRVDLDALVADTLRDLEIAIERAQGRVDVGPLGAVIGDPTHMRVLFQNLIDNALKYRKPGAAPHVEVRASRVPASAAAPETLRIEVKDDGIGFDPKYRERIFEIFERLHGRNEYEGTGIGLALCRTIAARNGGTITADSAPGVGSTFTVTLPAAEAHVAGGATAS